MWAAWAVCKSLVSTFCINYLTKGHTHEDVDGFLAELLPTLRRRAHDGPEDLVGVLQEDLEQRARNAGEDLTVQICHPREYSAWLEGLGVKLTNCFMPRGAVSVPQAGPDSKGGWATAG